MVKTKASSPTKDSGPARGPQASTSAETKPIAPISAPSASG